MTKVKFQLAGGHTALRHAVDGGREISINGRGTYQTDDPGQIALLDAHPATKRAAKGAPKPKTGTATPKQTAEETAE